MKNERVAKIGLEPKYLFVPALHFSQSVFFMCLVVNSIDSITHFTKLYLCIKQAFIYQPTSGSLIRAQYYYYILMPLHGLRSFPLSCFIHIKKIYRYVKGVK